MITKLHLNNIATYDNVTVEPNKINFIFGTNGTGKTTLSSMLNSLDSPSCSIEWENNTTLETCVFNRNFVQDNFEQTSNISGIFTLGKDSLETKKQIADLIEKNSKEIELKKRHKTTLDKKNDEEASELQRITDSCWTLKISYASQFSSALSGSIGTKEKFRTQCVQHYKSYDETKASQQTLDDLKEKYDSAYDTTRQILPNINLISLNRVKEMESCNLLNIPITGSDDSSLGTFIDFLNNSDWVKAGVDYTKKTPEKKCPFCQQLVTESIYNELEKFFDVTYEKKCAEIQKFYDAYIVFFKKISQDIASIIDQKYNIIDYSQLKDQHKRLQTTLTNNHKLIQVKILSPSEIPEIESVYTLLEEINKTVSAYNEIISNNTKILSSRNQFQNEFKNKLWDFLAYQKREEIKTFITQMTSIESAQKGCTTKITEIDKIIKNNKIEIQNLEKTQTSIQPSAFFINTILSNYGFENFKLAENSTSASAYKIIRKNGEDVKRTLSEGEYNFITFLYFYQLVHGSINSTGLNNHRVIVIDDPISSLDSNILFIVTSLLKDLVMKCNEDNTNIKQLFILTHNTYFYKEITFYGTRSSLKGKNIVYWHIQKFNDVSSINIFEKNPIKTIYEMLWDDVKNPSQHSAHSIFNTMRKILEHYFQLTGQIGYEGIILQFEDEDKITCKSLLSCINDGSHTIPDGFTMCISLESIDIYQKVFKMIFDKLGHISHYEMMMNRQ